MPCAIRSLLRAPGHSLLVILTLALGVGAMAVAGLYLLALPSASRPADPAAPCK